MRLDLHVHTNASDGAWPPEDVVEGAERGGLDVLALTDHDTTAGIAAARAAARGRSIQVVAGIEVSTTHEDREIHVLGYFVDPEARCLVEHATQARRLRSGRMAEMLKRLAAEGVDVELADVEAEAGGAGALSRPHLARVLVDKGFASSVGDAFQRLIGDDCPAFVPTRLATPAEGIALILEAGGIPSWAHPPSDLLEPQLPAMVEAGLRGLEVYRPAHKRHDVLRLEQECRRRDLLATGGSDWHTPDAGTALGDFHVRGEEVEAFLEAGGL